MAEALPKRYSFSAVSMLLQHLEHRCALHSKALSNEKRRGKRWDTELRRLHVHLTELLCEFIDESFQSSRDPRLLGVAEILAKPIFPPRTSFVLAAREQADHWNRLNELARNNPERLD